MGSPNQNWDRWIFASVSQHFKDNVADVFTIKQFVEGQFRDTNKENEFFEVRVDGPVAREVSKNNWQLVAEINCLISTGFSDKDFHKHRRNVGRVSSGFNHCISVFKYGTDVDDDQTLLGVLHLRGPTDDSVVTTHFGQVGPRTEMQQTTIEGHYEMELTT